MDFNLSDEQEMLRDGALRFVREQYTFEHRRKLAATAEGMSREHWKQYADMGWLALNLPEDVGGLGFSFPDMLILLEAFGRAMVLEPYLVTAVLVAHLVDRSGVESLRQSILPALAGGERLMAFAHDEPGRRGEQRPLSTLARREAEGYALNGNKTLVLGGHNADQLIVSCQDADGELLLCIVDRQAAGVTVDSYALLDGSHAADVLMHEVAVTHDCVLAHGNHAAEILAEALDRACLAGLAQMLGAMEGSLEVSSDYVKQRQQFGQPLAKFQALQHLLADMFVDIQQSRSMLYRSMAFLDGDACARRNAVSAAKIVIGPAGHRVSSSGVQLHGGYGTTDEYAISHYFRYLFVQEKLFGCVEEHIGGYQLSAN